MADHELDITNADRVTVTIGVARVSITAHEGLHVESVSIDLPAGPAVTWKDERSLDALTGEDWRPRYLQLRRVYISRLNASDALADRLVATEARLAELRHAHSPR